MLPYFYYFTFTSNIVVYFCPVALYYLFLHSHFRLLLSGATLEAHGIRTVFPWPLHRLFLHSHSNLQTRVQGSLPAATKFTLRWIDILVSSMGMKSNAISSAKEFTKRIKFSKLIFHVRINTSIIFLINEYPESGMPCSIKDWVSTNASNEYVRLIKIAM